jgi:hypothetical protein
MSDKDKRDLRLLDEALDDVEETPEQIAATTARLSVTPAAWAAEVRARAVAAKEAARQVRLQAMRDGFRQERDRYEALEPEPVLSEAEMHLVFSDLLAQASEAVSAHFHKYKNAPPEELAEQIRALRHLLGKKDEN